MACNTQPKFRIADPTPNHSIATPIRQSKLLTADLSNFHANLNTKNFFIFANFFLNLEPQTVQLYVPNLANMLTNDRLHFDTTCTAANRIPDKFFAFFGARNTNALIFHINLFYWWFSLARNWPISWSIVPIFQRSCILSHAIVVKLSTYTLDFFDCVTAVISKSLVKFAQAFCVLFEFLDALL